MTTTAPAATLTHEASRALGAADLPAVAAARAAAFADASTRAMPTTYERPWKYLDVSGLDLQGYDPAPAERFEVLSDPDGRVIPFATAAGGAKAAIERHFGSAVLAGTSRFSALHYAFLNAGTLIHVPANAEHSAPIRIARTYEGARRLAAPHTLIVTGANSRVAVIEEYRSGESDMVALPAVEVIPGPGSEVRYTAIHRWGAGTRAFAAQRTITERDSAFVGVSVVLGGRVVKSHIESSLTGRGSSSELFAVGVGRGSEQADFYTIQDHVAPDTRSDLLFKFALDERSRGVYYGLTRVGLGAKNADANQVNRDILLSKDARADSDPVLEILTNDVIRVSHGAAAGPVDEEQLFYLQARGIPRREAETLLVHGFLSQVLDRIPDIALREELEEALAQRMEH